MDLFYGRARCLSQKDLLGLHSYRYEIFVRRLGWNLPQAIEGFEADQFDTPNTIHIGARAPDGQMCGCARLLPTNEPYLLGDVFPKLLNGAPSPRTPDVWEISRFAAADIKSRDDSSESEQFDITLSKSILSLCATIAMENGAKRLIAVSPLGVEKLLTKLKIPFNRAAPPSRIGPHLLFACWIELDELTLTALNAWNVGRKSEAPSAGCDLRQPPGAAGLPLQLHSGGG